MPTEITIDASEADKDLQALIALFEDPGERRDAFELGGRAVQTNLRQYHRDFEAARKWTNPSLSTHGAGRKRSRFGEDITRGWSQVEASSDGVSITNTDPKLSLKVEGGTVRAKNARALTISMDPRAHDRSVRQFKSSTGLDPFRPRGKDYLAVVEDGEFKVVYLLRQSTTHKPWPGALPPEDQIVSPFMSELLGLIDGILD